MRRFLFFLFLAIVGILFLSSNHVYAAKKNTTASQTLKVVSKDGDSVIYGSVLSPKEDDANILLPKALLLKIRKAGLGKLSLKLTSTVDSTKTYDIPADGITLQRKVINKRSGKYLVVSLFNLTTQSGITISPSSLPSDTYKLSIAGSEINTTTDLFNYATPALVVGTVASKTTGLVTVENLNGDPISNGTVATNPNGTFFTEVRANKIGTTGKARKQLQAQESTGTINNGDTTNNNNEGNPESGVCHIVTDKDLYAIIPLDNDPNNNEAQSDNPLEVNESSTLTYNLAKDDETLAGKVAKKAQEDLQSGGNQNEDNFVDFDCPIDQFASQCPKGYTGGDDAVFSSIGSSFKEFLKTAACNFPGFDLIKNIVLSSPDDASGFIGKGYCQHTNRAVDENKPCQSYSQILKDFQDGKIPQLQCPPPFCTEFQNIQPPKCFQPTGFCEAQQSSGSFAAEVTCPGPKCLQGAPQSCIQRPVKDLYCAKIGVDIDASECTNNNFNGPSQFNPGWKIITNSKGNQYCVPSNIPQPPTPPSGFTGPQSTLTPEGIAEDCEVNSCHRDCENKFPHQGTIFTPPSGSTAPSTSGSNNFQPPKCDACDCHFTCDANAGRVIDCGNPLSKYFSVKCCGPGIQGFSSGFSGGGFGPQGGFSGPGGFGPQSGFVPIDIRGCLCGDTSSFNDKGYVKEDAQNTCRNKCPQGFEKDQYSDHCFPVCPEGTTRDPSGICRKKCPEGFTQDEFGNCKCPQGQKYDSFSRKCISGQCPQDQYLDPNGACRCISDGSIPAGPNAFCSQQGRICQPGEVYNPNTNPCRCAAGGSYGAGNICQCPGGQPYTPSGCNYGQNFCPPPYITNPSNNPPCKCPESIPISFSSTCVAKCPEGLTAGYPQTYGSSTPGSNYTPMLACLCPDKSYPDQNGKCYGSGQRYCGAGEAPTASNPCTCNPSGGSYFNSNNTCTCPSGSSSQTYTAATGCSNTSSTNYCSPGITVGTDSCTCNPSGGGYNSNGYCTCPTNSGPYTKETGCSSASSRPCTAGEGPSNNCYCFGGGYTGTDGKCQCSGSVQYTGGGCGITTCPSPYIKDPDFPQSCICPSSIPYELSGTCVAQCPVGTTLGTTPGNQYSSTRQTCKCPDGTYPTYDGKCGNSTTSHVCAAGEAATTSNPCYCASGGTFSGTGGTGTCQCTNGQTYTAATGCGTSTTSHVCAAGEAATTSNPCYCASGGTFSGTGGTGTCQCTNGQTYTAATGCGTSTTQSCPSPYVTNSAYNSSNPNGVPPCICPNGKYYYNNDCVATCPNSLVTSTPSSGCGAGPIPSCVCPGTLQCPGANGQCASITFTSAEISGSNLVTKFNSSNLNGGCPYLYNSAGTNIYSLCGAEGTRTENIPLSSVSSVMAGDILKLCQSNSPTNCSGTVTVSTPTPTPTPETLTLTSAQISGSNFTINYTRSGFSECVLLVKGNDNSIILHNGVNAYGLLCSQSGGSITTPLYNFNNITNGYSVKLCKGNGTDANTNTGLYSPNVCTAPIAVTSQ